MSCLVIFSVPLYRFFCDLTGFQGFNQETNNLIEQIDPKMGELEMKVVFSSQVNDGLDWNFEAPENARDLGEDFRQCQSSVEIDFAVDIDASIPT